MAATAERPRVFAEKGFLPFELEVLTPVFIGSGESFTPLDYAIRKVGQNYKLYLVDSESWLSDMWAQNRVNALLADGDMAKLRIVLAQTRDVEQYALDTLNIISDTIARQLVTRINNLDTNSKNEIVSFMRNPLTQTAFVPGSSIKGALSTPLIDWVDQQAGTRLKEATRADGPRKMNRYNETLEQWFGKIGEHAMQAVKIGDIAIPPGGTAIMAAVFRHLDPTKKMPLPPCEALLPKGPERLFGSLRLDSRSGKPGIGLKNGNFVDIGKLAELCNNFYKKRYLAEAQKFYQLAHFQEARNNLPRITEKIETLKPENGILLRVGHYSHVECVTVTGNAPAAPKGYGRTRTLAEGTLPFGWVILRFCDPARYWEGIAAVDKSIDSCVSNVKKRVQARVTKLEEERKRRMAKEEAAIARAAAEEAKAAQEAAKAADREKIKAAQGEEAAVFWDITQGNLNENEVNEVYARLESYSPEQQKELAKALKTCWEKMGKWSGKQSKKQAEKVKKIKWLLGE